MQWHDVRVFGSLQALSASVPPALVGDYTASGTAPLGIAVALLHPSPGSPSCSAALRVSGFLGSHPLSGGRFHR